MSGYRFGCDFVIGERTSPLFRQVRLAEGVEDVVHVPLMLVPEISVALPALAAHF